MVNKKLESLVEAVITERASNGCSKAAAKVREINESKKVNGDKHNLELVENKIQCSIR
jgi:hypothetical protein